MVELIEILEKRKDGDSDEYYFTVSYKGNNYKVMFKDWWFGNRNSFYLTQLLGPSNQSILPGKVDFL